MKETEWMDKKEYKRFLKDNKFIKVHVAKSKYECFTDKGKRITKEDNRITSVTFNEYVKVVYSPINLKEV